VDIDEVGTVGRLLNDGGLRTITACVPTRLTTNDRS